VTELIVNNIKVIGSLCEDTLKYPLISEVESSKDLKKVDISLPPKSSELIFILVA